ncbi:MAG: 30S ribosomal protein S6 [Planctomycetota bacterium]|jgi:ribosomal protein S6
MNLYEGMFVIDNDLVREDWQAAKGLVTSALEKHGATIHTARRWDERALAYPIKGRRRATYLLTYFEIEGDRNNDVARDLEIQDGVLRYLVTSAAEVPEAEVEAHQAEGADDFAVPPPPADSVGTYRPIQVEEEESEEESEEGSEDAEGEAEEGGEAKAEGEASDAPAAEKTESSDDAAPAEASDDAEKKEQS